MPRTILVCALAAVLLSVTGCGGSKSATQSGAAQYRRSPIVEVAEKQLSQDALLIDAKTQQELDNHDEALAIYRRLLQQNPDYGAACYGMSQLMASTGRVDSARYYAERAVQTDDSNVWYHLWVAQIYQLTGNTRQLVETWEKLVSREPEKVEYYYELSNSYIAAGNVTKAVETLNRVEKIIGVTEPIALQKQKLWNALNRPDKARKEIEALARALPQEKKYNAMLAESYMKEKDYKKAKMYYDRAVAADPDDQYLHIALASYYKAVNQPEEAFHELQKGFRGDAFDTPAKVQLLASFYSQEEFYGSCSTYAFALLDELMQQSNDSLSYAVFYGDVLMRQEKYAEAAHQFRLHLSNDSSQYEIWEALLICESEMDSAEEMMLDHARRTAALFPLHPLSYYLQGYSFFSHNNYAEAVKMFKQCEKVGFPKKEGTSIGYLEAETYSLLAECYYRLGDHQECFAYYDRFLTLYPNDIPTLNNYAYYLAEQEMRLEEAERMSARTIQAEPDNATYLDTYAWVLHRMGRDTEALKYIKKAIANDKKNSTTLRDHLEAIEQGRHD